LFTFLNLIKPFFLPPTLIAAGMFVSLILLIRKKHRFGKIVLCITLSAYYFLSIEPVSYILATSLENSPVADVAEESIRDVEAIVVLAGGADKANGNRRFSELGGASWKRLWHGIEVYRRYGGRIPILYSGGSGDPFDAESVEARLAGDYALSMGIPEGRFWIEGDSRNTYESGIKIKEMLDRKFPYIKDHRIILVTSATHIARASGVMKQVGIRAIPSPADYAFGDLSIDPLSFVPSTSCFYISTSVIHEWLGLLGYRLMGRM